MSRELDPPISTHRARLPRLAQMLRHDTSRLIRTGVPYLFFALIGTTGMSMVRRILLARILSVAELGQMTYAMRIVDLVVVLADLGICTAVLKFASEPVSENEKQRIYAAGLLWSTLFSSLAATLYLITFLYVVPSHDEALRVFMLMLIPYIPLATVAKVPLLFMQARKEIKRAAQYTIITQALSLVLVIGATLRFGLWGFFVTVTVAPLSNLSILLFVTRNHVRWFRPTLAVLRKLVSFGVFSMAANATGFANGAVAVVLLRNLTGSDEAVGVYAVGLMVLTGMTLIPNSLMQVAFPYLSGLLTDKQRLMHRTWELSMKQAGFMALATLAWCIIGTYAIAIVFGSRYAGAYWISIVLLAGLVPFSAGAPSGQTLLILGRVNLNFLVSLLQLSINAVLCYILIPRWDTLGAAASVSCAQLVASCASIGVLRSVLRRDLREAGVSDQR